MNLKDYQKQVDDWAQQFKKPYWSPLSQFARLAEEVGEVGRCLNHKYGDKNKKTSEDPDNLAGELGDVLFDVMCMANSEGIDLDDVMTNILHKVNTRDNNRFEKK